VIEPAEAGELAAMRDLVRAAPTNVATQYGAEVTEIGGAVCISLAGAPRSAMFNRVLGLGLAAPARDEDVDRIDAFFRGREVEYCVALAPQAQPRELADRLQARGLARGYGWAKFSRSVADPPQAQTTLRIEEVGRDRAADFAGVFTRAYGTPAFFEPWIEALPGRDGWHCFVAYEGDEPAATGAVYVDDGVGWLGTAGTLPEHRRKGAQSALLSARIETAAAAGCEVVVTETGEAQEGRSSNSYRNILRAAFEFQYVRPNYLSSPDADTSGTRA
jgi:hypothetical protein